MSTEDRLALITKELKALGADVVRVGTKLVVILDNKTFTVTTEGIV